MQVNSVIFVYFAKIMATNYVEKKFSVLALEVRFFLKWLVRVDVPAVNSIFEIMKKNLTLLRNSEEIHVFQMF